MKSNSHTPISRNWRGKQPPYKPHTSADTGDEPPAPIAKPPPSLSQGRQVTVSSQFDQPGYEAAKAVDGDSKTRWASDFAARSGWHEVDLGEEKRIRRVWLSEIEWPETREFAIEIKQGDAWREIARGTTIGTNKEILFPPVKARFVRLNVLKAEHAVNINEFQVFAQ